jgi:hypothetical protein
LQAASSNKVEPAALHSAAAYPSAVMHRTGASFLLIPSHHTLCDLKPNTQHCLPNVPIRLPGVPAVGSPPAAGTSTAPS